MAAEATSKTAPAAETAIKASIDKIDEAATCLSQGKADEFFSSLWQNHQAAVINFGKTVLLAIIVLVIAYLLTKVVKKLIMKTADKVDSLDSSIGKLLFAIAKFGISLLTFLIIIDLFGVNTASVITVLGAAGLAVALAMKDSLSNIAAGLMLLFMRPYKVGDFVDCGSVTGTISELGLFSTIVTTLDGIFISVPNSTIFGNPIKNYSRNARRMANITVGISYSDNLPQAIDLFKKMMDENEQILKDPAPMVLVDLADSSVNLTLRFWTSNDVYWDVYWEVKAQLKATIEDAGFSIPFPQRVITFANKES